MYQQLVEDVIKCLQKEGSTFVDYDRNHVFFDILRFSSSKTPKEEKLDMYYQFNCYQRILDNARSGKPKIAQFWIDHLNGAPKDYSSIESLNGMNSLYYPAVAFYAYMQKDYPVALLQLGESFKSIDILFEAGFKEAIFMKIEQKLNEFRIHYSMKQEDEAIHVMSSLLSYLVSEQPDVDFKINAGAISRNQDEVIGLLNYCFDSLFFKVYRSKNYMESFQDDLMLKIMRNVQQTIAPDFSYLKKPMEAFCMVLMEDKTHFSQEFNVPELLDDRLPSMMRYAFIVFLMRLFEEDNIDLTVLVSTFKEYNKSNLKLPDLFLDTIINKTKNEELAES